MALGLSNNLAQAALMGQKPEEDFSIIPSQQQFAQDLNMMGARPTPVQPNTIGQGTVLQQPDNRAIINQTMSQAGVPQLDKQILGAIQEDQRRAAFNQSVDAARDAYNRSYFNENLNEFGRISGVPNQEQLISNIQAMAPQDEPRVQAGRGTSRVLEFGFFGGDPNRVGRGSSGSFGVREVSRATTPNTTPNSVELLSPTESVETSTSAVKPVDSQATQTLSEFLSQRDIPTPAPQLPEGVQPGRQPFLQSQLARPSMGLGTDPQGRMIPAGFETRAEAFPEYERQAAAREFRLGSNDGFGAAQPVASRQQAAETGIPTDAELRDLAQARMPGASEGEIARGMKVASRYGIDPLTGKRKEEKTEVEEATEQARLDLIRAQIERAKREEPAPDPEAERIALETAQARLDLINKQIEAAGKADPDKLAKVTTEADRLIEGGVLPKESRQAYILGQMGADVDEILGAGITPTTPSGGGKDSLGLGL